MQTGTKFYLLAGTAFMDLVYAATSPVIQIYFMKLISSEILAAANILSTGLAAVVNATVQSDKLKDFYRYNFLWIVSIDVVCFCLINFESISIPEVRYLGMAILNAISSTLWFTVISDAINHQIDGDALTKWNSLSKTVNLIAALLGSLLAILVFSNIEVETCILMQCVANLVMGLSDLKAYHKIRY